MEFMATCYGKGSNVVNEEIQYIELNQDKEKVGDYRKERNKINMITNFRNDADFEDMIDNTSNKKKCVNAHDRELMCL